MNETFKPYLDRIQDELAAALPFPVKEDWVKSAFGRLYDGVEPSHMTPLLKPTCELVSLGGKRWRPLFLVLCAQAVLVSHNAPEEAQQGLLRTAFHLTPLVEFVHTASLIHDDIEDSSQFRRGKPAAYISYGLDTALNAASWLYFTAPICINTLLCPQELKAKLYYLYSMELRRLHLGQAMDIAWHRDKNFLPSVKEYLAMVQLKTGTLASLAAKIGVLSAGADKNLIESVGLSAAKIGAGFQIIDDVINLTSGNPGKKRGDDIVEGKKSLPVLLFLAQEGLDSIKGKKLVECFSLAGKEGIDSPSVEEAIGLLENSGLIEEARKRGLSFIEKGSSEFEELFGKDNSAVKKIALLFKEVCHA